MGGLLLGFAGLALAVGLGGLAAVVWAIHTQRATVGAVALLAVGGALAAHATARDDARCLDALAARRQVTLVLVHAAAPGELVRGSATACHAAVSVSVVSGVAGAGATAVATGFVTRSRGGLLVQRARIRTVARGSRLLRWRAAAGVRVDSLFGSDAPLARALLVADRRGIPAAVRDRYAAAGMAHMLSISGLHVALIAGATVLFLQLVGLSRRRADGVTVVIVTGYVALLGAPPPALRAATMLAVYMASRWLQRPTSPWAVLSVGAAMPLVDPRAVTTVGYQLSVAGVAALIAAAALRRRWKRLAALHGVRQTVVITALASTMATIVTAPLVAWNFGRLSLVGPVANVFAAPLIALAQPMMFLALALSPVAPVARWLADAAHPLLRGFDFVASTAAAIPGASVAVAPSAVTACLGAVFAVALVTACVSRFPSRAVLVAAAALTGVAWAPFVPHGSGRTELHVIDVGRGEAVALRTARGRWVLIDAGPAWRTGDAGRSTVVPYLAHRGGRLAAFVLTSAAAGDVGGAVSVIRLLRPRDFYDAASGHGGAAYVQSLREARRDGVAWHPVRAGGIRTVDEVRFRFLAPDSARAAHDAAGRATGVVLAQVGSVRILLAGRLSAGEAQWLLHGQRDLLRADVLVVEGQRNSPWLTSGLLSAVSPQVAVLSTARTGPAPAGADAARRLAEAGAQTLRTDLLSTVVIGIDGQTLRVSAGGDGWSVPVRPSRTPGRGTRRSRP